MKYKIKDVEGFENYTISTKGEVFSKNYNRTGEKRKLKLLKDKYGYLYVRLSIKRYVTKHKTVHRLVAESFIPNPEGKSQVNHIDGNKENNFIENLEWVTSKENIRHSFRTGLQKPNITRAKLSYKIAEEIREKLKNGIRGNILAKEYSVYPGTISSIKRRTTWKTE